jgi:hypothetical protein
MVEDDKLRGALEKYVRFALLAFALTALATDFIISNSVVVAGC